MRGPAPIVRVPAFADFPVRVFAIVGIDAFDSAVVFHAAGALIAVGTEARERLGADADAIADSVGFDIVRR